MLRVLRPDPPPGPALPNRFLPFPGPNRRDRRPSRSDRSPLPAFGRAGTVPFGGQAICRLRGKQDREALLTSDVGALLPRAMEYSSGDQPQR